MNLQCLDDLVMLTNVYVFVVQVLLDNIGCAVGCSVLADSIHDSPFMVARKDVSWHGVSLEILLGQVELLNSKE